jgi:hypothetical protein
MQDVLGPGTTLGYCTNVHPGTTLERVADHLRQHAGPVRQRLGQESLGIGLWFSAAAARQARDEPMRLEIVRQALAENQLQPFTLNGFPFGDFHRGTVKESVYLPHWADPRRLGYTTDLAWLLAELLPEGAEGSVSTLPIGWPSSFAARRVDHEQTLRAAAAQLLDLVHRLARLELDTGRYLHVDLEPEPGCVVHSAETLVDFFERYLLGGRDDESVLSYLRVCHDVCHSAVMFETQDEALSRYRAAGLRVGKVQLSSALRVPFDEMDRDARDRAWRSLQGFAEDRYLHQTAVRLDDGRVNLFADLPDALREAAADGGPRGEWRVHFHVPIFAAEVEGLDTTRDELGRLLAAVRPEDGLHHFEVETYAWGVLPEAARPADLNDGIAQELRYVIDEVAGG